MVVYFLSARDMSKSDSFVFAESQFYSIAVSFFIQKVILICIVTQNLNQISEIVKGWKPNFITNFCRLFLYFKDTLQQIYKPKMHEKLFLGRPHKNLQTLEI